MNPASDQDRLIEHSYDGIQEYDNPLPRWWIYLFVATIVYSVFYGLNIGVGPGPGRIAQYEAEMTAFRAAHPPPEAGPSASELAALVNDPAAIKSGQQVFITNCASCHKPDGGGMIGPNLTDNAWIHGGTLEAIHQTIVNGVLAKGMPPWGKLLKPDQIDAVTAFVASLKGTNPPGAKAPEGEVMDP